MSLKNQTYKSGTCLLLSSGEYSDYSVWAVCYVLRDIDTREVVLEFFKEHQDQTEPYRADFHVFFTWLVKHQYVAEMPNVEWNVGNYGTIDTPE